MKRFLSCGHKRDRVIIHRNLVTGWCWRCQGPVRLVRIPRIIRLRKRAVVSPE